MVGRRHPVSEHESNPSPLLQTAKCLRLSEPGLAVSICQVSVMLWSSSTSAVFVVFSSTVTIAVKWLSAMCSWTNMEALIKTNSHILIKSAIIFYNVIIYLEYYCLKNRPNSWLLAALLQLCLVPWCFHYYVMCLFKACVPVARPSVLTL